MVRHVTVCVNRVEYLFINVAVYSREGFSLPPHPYIYIENIYTSPAKLTLVFGIGLKGLYVRNLVVKVQQGYLCDVCSDSTKVVSSFVPFCIGTVHGFADLLSLKPKANKERDIGIG